MLRAARTIIATAAIAVGAFAIAATPASAASVTLTKPSGGWGLPGEHVTSKVSFEGKTRNLWTGTIQIDADFGSDVERFAAWCIEIGTTLRSGATYDLVPLVHVGSAQLHALVDNVFGTLTSKTDHAAFQLAVWEISEDGGMDLSAGTLSAGKFNATARTTAQTWLDRIESGEWTADGTYELSAFRSSTSQDLITATRSFGLVPSTEAVVATPVPPAAAGLIAALAGLGILRRRRGA